MFEEETADGVPEIIPVEVAKESPAGNEGEIEYEATVPVTLGVRLVIAVFLVKV